MQEVARKILADKGVFSPEELIRHEGANVGREPGDEFSDLYLDWQKAYYKEFNRIPSKEKWGWRLHRVSHCMRTIANGSNSVLVQKGKDKKVGHYTNLQTCGSACSCPVCAAKITEHRCQEIVESTENWYSEPGHTIVMVTLTIPHNIGQTLQYVLEKFIKARRKMREQQPLKKRPDFIPWKMMAEQYKLAGTITAKECTVGKNGWHVHSHELLFLERELTDKEIQELRGIVVDAWIDACQKIGLEIPNLHNMKKYSVDVTRAKTPADYITKFGSDDYHKYKEILSGGWGAAQEISKAHVKKSSKGKTPFDLLRDIATGGEYQQNAKKFYEFTKYFKGKRLIFFSKGFRRKLNLGIEMTDQEIADEKSGENEKLGILTKQEFKIVCKYGMRANLLIIAGQKGWASITQMIGMLKLREKQNGERSHEREDERGNDQGNPVFGCI